MKLAEFKILLKATLQNDVRVPDDTELLPLIKLAANKINNSVHPLEMIESDEHSFDVDFWLDEKYFVRVWNELDSTSPIAQEQSIGYENIHLCNALVYQVAYYIGVDATRKVLNERAMFSQLMSYSFNMFDENLETIEESLKKQGFYKPYTMDYTIENPYVWEESFLDALDIWMMDNTQKLDPSYRRFIEDFVKYQNEELTRPDLVALDDAMEARVI